MKSVYLLPLILLLHMQTSASTEYAERSLYQLPVVLTDQDNNNSALDVFVGHPVIISMFYGSCPHVCPMLLSTIQMTENKLPDEIRSKLRVLLISVDPDNDTPAALGKVAKRHHLDMQRWKLTRTSATDVRKIAAVLNIRYRQLDNGEFNHSTVISLLDQEGVIQARTSKLPGIDIDFLNMIQDKINKH